MLKATHLVLIVILLLAVVGPCLGAEEEQENRRKRDRGDRAFPPDPREGPERQKLRTLEERRGFFERRRAAGGPDLQRKRATLDLDQPGIAISPEARQRFREELQNRNPDSVDESLQTRLNRLKDRVQKRAGTASGAGTADD